MRFLNKEEFEYDPCSRWSIKLKVFKAKFEETYNLISKIIKSRKWNHDLLGISLTFYHYFLYFKDFREIDPYEISVCCIYLTNKIQFMHYGLDFFIKIYNEINEKKKNNQPDFIKLEIEMYTKLGYDLQIKTPYSIYYDYIMKKNNIDEIKENIRKNFLFNLINDTYRKSICLYFHPKIIMISCLIYTNKFLEMNDEDLNEIINGEDLDLIAECMDKIYDIFKEAINENDNNNNNNNNNHLNNINNEINNNSNKNNNNNS